MKFGLAYEMQRPVVDEHALIEETIEQCVLADEMGWDYIWFVEHHFLTGFSMSPCPEVIFGALSKLTKRIRLGFGVVVLPYHHPVRVAERVAMVDHLSGGRVDLGTGRSAAFEQTGMGIDPRESRAMWEESITMIPKIWESERFEWEGRFWNVPPRTVLPKPYQDPHPPLWVAAHQPATYALAAQKGIGVMALGVTAPSLLAPHIKTYKENVKKAAPVSRSINDQWLSSCMGYCEEDDRSARDLAVRSLKTFFGPDKPYIQDLKDVYERLVTRWGGVPDHLSWNFARYVDMDDVDMEYDETAVDYSGGIASAQKAWEALDAETLVDRGVLVAGDPDSCIRAARLHEEAGVDQLQLLMATQTIGHEKVMKSIEMFGKYVLPEFRGAEKTARV